MTTIKKYSALVLLLSLIAIGANSCSDNPATPTQEHVEVFGVVIYNSGAEIVRYEKGVVTGEFDVAEGDDTPLLNVRFLDEQGNIIPTDKVADKAFSLRWTVANTAIADVEQHADDGKWNFHIAGKKEGSTSIKIQLFHNDHADFTSKEIPIHVEKGIHVASMKILLDGTEVASASPATGSIALQQGNAATLEVQLFDEDGAKLVLEDHHAIELEVANASLVTVQEGSAKGLFTVTGVQKGETTVQVHLEKEDEHGHSGDEHDPLYTSPALPLLVQ